MDWRAQGAAAAAAAATKDGRENSRRLDRILISKGVENFRRRFKDERRANIVQYPAKKSERDFNLEKHLVGKK